MAKVEEDFGHKELVDGSVTTLHSHPSRIKSGIILDVIDSTIDGLVFASPFNSTPQVILTLHSSIGAVDIPLLRTVSRFTFIYELHKGHGGANHTWNLHWIATDADNL